MSIASMSWVLILPTVRNQKQSLSITHWYMYRTNDKYVLVAGQIYSLNDARYFDCEYLSTCLLSSQASRRLSDARALPAS